MILENFPSQQTRQLFLNGYAAEVLGQEQNEDFISGFDVSELIVRVGDYYKVIISSGVIDDCDALCPIICTLLVNVVYSSSGNFNCGLRLCSLL